MSGACSTHGRGYKCIQTFSQMGNLKGRDYLEDLGTDLKIILRWILKKYGVRCGLDGCSSG